MHIGLQVKYRLLLSDFNDTWSLPTDFLSPQVPNFVKIRPVGAELFHAGGRTDRHGDKRGEVNTRFS